jgi:gas vesicle protein
VQEAIHMSDSRGDFLIGLLVGGVIGLAAGVLFAPAAGEETRQSIRRRTGGAVSRVRAGADEVGERVREGIGRARDGAAQLASEIRSRLPIGGNGSTEMQGEPVPGPEPAGS